MDRQGWVCPQCHAARARHVDTCPHCGPVAKSARLTWPAGPETPTGGATMTGEAPFMAPLGETFTHGGARRG